MPGCDCSLEATNEEQVLALRVLLAINATMFAVELVAGLYADSAGVLADSLDMLADALVYGVALRAVGRCAGTKRRAARLAGWAQLLMAALMAAELGRRILMGSEPLGWLMLGVSALALAANAWCLRLLSRHKEGGSHMRATWIFTRTDVLANAGVILAALLVHLTGSPWADWAIGALILLVVLDGARRILSENSSSASCE